MQIRGTSQHAQCGTCVRHRHLIKSLGRHLLARSQQQTFYWQHLREQYLDRLEYYRLRSLSRQRDGRFICIIQDGMDQGKVSLPRSPWLQSKEFAQFKIHRPKLHVSLTLVHGYFTLWTISHPDTMKDSNASIETMCHALHLLESEHGVCLRGCSLSIHADNTCREVKNNPFMRWAALQTSCSNLKSVSVRFLRSGHSHEDVDQAFGRLARHLSRLKVAQEPDDFLDSIKQFASGMGRPHEAHSYVTIMAQTRDWTLRFLLSNLSIHLTVTSVLQSVHFSLNVAAVFDLKSCAKERVPCWCSSISCGRHRWAWGTAWVYVQPQIWWRSSGPCRWQPFLGVARASRGCDFEDCMATWLDQKHHHHYQHDYQNSPLQENWCQSSFLGWLRSGATLTTFLTLAISWLCAGRNDGWPAKSIAGASCCTPGSWPSSELLLVCLQEGGENCLS